MRHDGTISRWNDDKGFGFIAPDDGGRPVFVHIGAFTSRGRRPVASEPVTYALGTDRNGRARAVDVKFLRERSTRAIRSQSAVGALVVALPFMAFVFGAVVAGKLPSTVLLVYVIASTVAFAVYAMDKSAASNDRWRTPESTLHLLGLAGGWPGALIAQRMLRHKSKKRPFQVVFWGTVILNCSGLAWLLSGDGARALRAALALT